MEGAAYHLAREVASLLRGEGYQCWLVGGCVRDRLLGLPVHDLDLSTEARPERLLELLPEARVVGASFGVVLLKRGGVELQIATFRSETAYSDGRHPDAVRFEDDVRADVGRRDFTMNALVEDPLSGEVVDYVGGRADLEAGIVRAIGDATARFAEDHLRLLRAVRFAARLSFTIEPETFAAMREAAPAIGRISGERVRDELTRILTEGHARRGFELLEETGLLKEILPEVAAMRGVAQPPEFHPEGDVWEHTLRLLERLREPSIELALAALLHDVGKPPTQTFEDRIRFSGHEAKGEEMARAMLTRLRYPGEVIDAVCRMVAQHMKFPAAAREMREATFKRFVRQAGFDELLELHRLDLVAADRPLTTYESVRARREAIPPEEVQPGPLINGHDLIALGLEPGPRFAEILHEAETLQLEGELRDRGAALEWLRRRFRPV